MILEIETPGCHANKTKEPGSGSGFYYTTFFEELKNRLIGRGTETEEVINSRLARAAEEAEEMDKYDYIVVNDQVEDVCTLPPSDYLKRTL